MLKRLDEIDWSKLHHSHGGAADDVPVLNRTLLSKDEHERAIAFQKLLSDIWHDGTIWEVTRYEIPSLWELLKSFVTPDKLLVVNLITVLAREEGWYLNIMKDEAKKITWQESLSHQGKNLDEEIEKAERYCREVRLEIANEFPLLYPYLFCEEPLIRDYVAKAFEKYPEFKSETLLLLEKALLAESDEFARKTVENSIKILSETE